MERLTNPQKKVKINKYIIIRGIYMTNFIENLQNFFKFLFVKNTKTSAFFEEIYVAHDIISKY